MRHNPARSDFQAFQAQELLEEIRLNRDFLDVIFELNEEAGYGRSLSPGQIYVIRNRMERQADQVLELDPTDHALGISASALREIPGYIERGSDMFLRMALDDSETGLEVFIAGWPPRGYQRNPGGDERLRELERTAQTGSIEDRRRYVDELMRRGLLQEGDRVPGPFWKPGFLEDTSVYEYLHTSYFPARQDRFTGPIERSFYDFYHYRGPGKVRPVWDQDLLARHGNREDQYSSNSLEHLTHTGKLSPLGLEKRRIAEEILARE